tara:strand:+ start:153 stop:2165 length:2013 start_codon:yes stop_codon:yes gene_type:complete
MGFNFGAFAGGALKGAGDVMEKQHKETKDSIDSSMKFAYEQGLPFHRERQKRLRKLTGMANDVANFGLTDDEVNAVMGQSEAQIQAFIDGSIKQIKMTSGKFDPASQINIAEGGTVTPWADVQMGTIDLPNINRPTQTSRRTLFGSMAGTDTSGPSAGFNNMVDKTRQQMASITGTSYEDVAAAGQGAYKYGQRTGDSTVTLVDTSVANAAELQAIQLDNSRKLGSTVVDTQIFNLKRARLDAERVDALQPLKDKQAQLALLIVDKKLETNSELVKIQADLKLIEDNAKRRISGGSPQEGLYIAQHALITEQMKDNPDPAKIAALIKTRGFLEIALAEQNVIDKNTSATVSFGQYNTHFDATWKRLLTETVSDDKMWITDTSTNITSFDYSKKNAVLYQKAAMQKAMTEMITNARRTGHEVTGAFKNWLGLHAEYYKGDVGALTTAPMLPRNKDEIKSDVTYLFRDKVSPPEGATIKNKDGARWGWSLPTPTGDVVVQDVIIFSSSTGAEALSRMATNEKNKREDESIELQKNTDGELFNADQSPGRRNAEGLTVEAAEIVSQQNGRGRMGQALTSTPPQPNDHIASTQADIDQENTFKKLAKINGPNTTPEEKDKINAIHQKLTYQFRKGTYDPATVQEEISYLLANGISHRRMMMALKWQKSLSAAVQ